MFCGAVDGQCAEFICIAFSRECRGDQKISKSWILWQDWPVQVRRHDIVQPRALDLASFVITSAPHHAPQRQPSFIKQRLAAMIFIPNDLSKLLALERDIADQSFCLGVCL